MKTSILFGLVFAVTQSVMVQLMSRQTALLVLAVILGSIYGVYLGFSLSVGEKERLSKNDQKNAWALFDFQTTIEMCFIVVSIIIGVKSVQHESVALMSLGYGLHGLWDLLHHFTLNKIKVPRWYIPFCFVVDITVAILIYFTL
ncbi:hypothetical protein G6F56_013148 [Rhizopus delemar]|nr:hypothetical protein G6F56_013148 [Rhizopus delemar]